MWSAAMVIVVSLGVAAGLFLAAWVVGGLTIGLFAILYIFYTLNLSSRSLFGKLDGSVEGRAEGILFRFFVAICAFYLSMWLALFLK
jgi:hypothetical protein